MILSASDTRILSLFADGDWWQIESQKRGNMTGQWEHKIIRLTDEEMLQFESAVHEARRTKENKGNAKN